MMNQNEPTRNQIALAALTTLIPRYGTVDEIITTHPMRTSAIEASFVIADAFLAQSKR